MFMNELLVLLEIIATSSTVVVAGSYDVNKFGTSWEIPKFALLRFSTEQSCQLSESWHVQGDNQGWPLIRWESSDGSCGKEVSRMIYDTFIDWYGLRWANLKVNTDTCEGTYSVDIHATSSKDVLDFPWNNGKLLCNDLQVFAFLANYGNSGNDYLLYYTINVPDSDEWNMGTYYSVLVNQLGFRDGEYCLDLFKLLSKLLYDAPANQLEDLTCISAEPIPSPPEDAECQGKAALCNSDTEQDCDDTWGMTFTCAELKAQCEADPTCGKQEGCRCVLHEVSGTYERDGYIDCAGSATPCHEMKSESACVSQTGCEWILTYPPTDTPTNKDSSPPTDTPTNKDSSDGDDDQGDPPTDTPTNKDSSDGDQEDDESNLDSALNKEEGDTLSDEVRIGIVVAGAVVFLVVVLLSMVLFCGRKNKRQVPQEQALQSQEV